MPQTEYVQLKAAIGVPRADAQANLGFLLALIELGEAADATPDSGVSNPAATVLAKLTPYLNGHTLATVAKLLSPVSLKFQQAR